MNPASTPQPSQGENDPVWARQITLLAALSVESAAHMDEAEMIQTVCQWILQVSGAQLAAVYVYEPESKSLVTMAISDSNYAKVGEHESLDDGILGETARSRCPLFTNTYQTSVYRGVTEWPLQAVATAPMLARDQLLGVIAVGYETDDKFSADDIQTLSWLAAQASVALDNQRLFKTTQQKAHQLHLLNALTYAANSIEDYDELLQYMADTLNGLFNSDSCSLAMWDEENQIPKVVAAAGSQRKQTMKLRIAAHTPSFTAQVIARNHPIVVSDIHDSDMIDPQLAESLTGRTLLGLPLMVGENHLGAAFVLFNEARHLTQTEIDISAQVADQIALVITRAQLLAGERRQRQLAEIQLTFSNLLIETTSAGETGMALMESIGTLLDYDSGSVMLVQEGDRVGTIVASAGYMDPDEAGGAAIRVNDYPLLKELYDTVNPIYISDLRERQGWQPGKTQDAQEVRTLFFIPLRHHKELIIGHLILKSYRTDAFPLAERNQIQILCNQAAVTLQNQLLLRQSLQQSTELSAAYEDLQRLNQVRDDFVHNASHELRTPLTFIQGYAGMLAENMLGDLTPEQLDAIQIILKRAESMNMMIQEMVDYQKADSTALIQKEVDVYALVQGCIRAAHISAQEAGVRFNLAANPTLPAIYADAQRLGQVFDNLFSNAIKFSHDQGEIFVTLSAQEKQIRIDIADQGVGIPQDQLDLIWNRFYRVKDTAHNVRGTGLGLAIVHQIIQAHGGRIWAESPDVGSIFHIELPIVKED